MRWSLTRGQTAALVLLVAALLVDAVLTLHNIREVATGVQWVSHTHEVLSEIEQAMSTLKDAETGQRGYLLTGERPYLEPYEQALPRLRGQLARLRALTIDNPPQTAHVLKLEQLTAERLAVLQQGVDRFQAEPNFLDSIASNARTIHDTFHNATLNEVWLVRPSVINNFRYG